MSGSRVIAVTGAAAGIGRAAVLTLAARGWTVGALDLDEAGLDSLAQDVRRRGGVITTARLDVTDAAAFAGRLGDLAAEHGRLDALVNNAGVLRAGGFESIDVAALRSEVEVNVLGTLHGAHAAYPHLREAAQRHGAATLVNLASASAIYGQAELANYSATKFYVRGLTEALDLEWRRHGIRVVDLWPLFVQTGMLEGVSTATTGNLGVNLTAQDVADALLDALDPGPLARLTRQVHHGVGLPARAMAAGARFSPAWLTRAVNDRLARH